MVSTRSKRRRELPTKPRRSGRGRTLPCAPSTGGPTADEAAENIIQTLLSASGPATTAMPRLDCEACAKLAESERRRQGYFDVALKLQAERDRWREMFHEQADEHHAAQMWLERELAECRTWVGKLLRAVNLMLEQQGAEKVDPKLALDGPPVGRAELYRRAMDDLVSRMGEAADARVALAAVDVPSPASAQPEPSPKEMP